MMAHPSDHRLCSPGLLRLVLVLVGVVLVGFVVGPPFLWLLKGNSSVEASCPPCSCDCSSETILSMPLDCGKDDPEMSEEMEKDIITLLSEELSLQKNVSNDNLEHTKVLIKDARQTSSHYQKEAEKCNTGVETCEEAREKAEAALIEERKQTEEWKKRALEHGWKDEREVY
ncbi:uncharacterized protein LOC132294653 [Cornus florida]|uniref:uncharacterized protein LOC132294653 n=1 Tax=Cornus florida TaxID=4283 RepID=UPI00289AD54D|nr:uncharacterized protein LOC132294653 [Cornus florida]